MSCRVPFVDLAAQQTAIAWELDEALDDVASRSDWILGRDLELFEEEFADYCESLYAVGVDSGLSALELALRALEVGPGDEVITAANTFVATVFAIAHVDATPVLVDVDPKTYTLDPEAVRAAITKRTRAIVPVHLYGQPADMDSLAAIARTHGVLLIEDACQAHGARYKGQRVGSMGDAAAFSFYPAKNLGAHGDGGMVVTRRRELRDRLCVLRNYGQQRKNHHVEVGFNRRLDTLQAAILRVKLRHLDAWNKARRAIAKLYDELLPDHVIKPTAASDVEPVWHLYPIQVERARPPRGIPGAGGHRDRGSLPTSRSPPGRLEGSRIRSRVASDRRGRLPSTAVATDLPGAHAGERARCLRRHPRLLRTIGSPAEGWRRRETGCGTPWDADDAGKSAWLMGLAARSEPGIHVRRG